MTLEVDIYDIDSDNQPSIFLIKKMINVFKLSENL